MDERNDYNSIPLQPTKTAVEWFLDNANIIPKYELSIGDPIDKAELSKQDTIDKAKQIERKQIIDFHNWMMKNDTPENAERYFHYTDNDMLNEYLNQNNL